MIRTFKFMSIAGIVTSLFLIIYLPFFKSPESLAPDKFPIDKSKIVEFDLDPETFAEFTNREQTDQLLDWLLYTMISASDLSINEINQVLYDLPAIRYGYIKPIGNFEYGEIRSAYLGKGKVIALLSSTSIDERMSQLIRIADNHRSDQEKFPEVILIFEYKISPDNQFATVTQRKPINGNDLFTKEYGYFESKISNINDLEHFLKEINDITYTQIEGNDLLVGGRKIKEDGSKKMRTEDIAALWQAEKKMAEEIKKFEERWEKDEKVFHEKMKEYYTFTEITRKKDESDEGWKERMREAEKLWNAKQEKLEEAIQIRDARKKKEWEEQHLIRGSGFSLDWTYNFEVLTQIFSNNNKYIWQLIQKNGLEFSKEDLRKIHQSLQNKNADPFLKLIESLSKSSDERAGLLGLKLKFESHMACFQTARYDGNLEGTEVGMVLFYTDLLAKILGFNYLNTTEIAGIEDFIPKTKIPISPIYKEEAEQSSYTRMWFGTEQSEFSVSNSSDKLHFSRNITRAFAASSNRYNPGKETVPNAYSATFVDWWNNHFEEVARFESEYCRLNQIMKWSLLISWLEEQEQGQFFSFLDAVEVDHSSWFPEWVRKQDHLKFDKWSEAICAKKPDCKIAYYKRGYAGTKHEAMPLLVSSFNKKQEEIRSLVGGVSLPTRTSIKINKATPKLKLDNLRNNPRREIYQYNGEVKTTVKNISSDKASVSSVGKQGIKGKGKSVEISNLRFERTVLKGRDNISFKTQVGKSELGNLNIARGKNGFKIGWESRSLDIGQRLTKDLSKASNPRTFLTQHSKVEFVVETSVKGQPQYMVQLRGSNQWIKISRETNVRLSKTGKMEIRVADVKNGKSMRATMVDEATAIKDLSSQNYAIQTANKSNTLTWRAIPKRGPPGKPIKIKIGNKTFKGEINTKGDISFSGKQLKNLSKNELSQFQKALDKAELTTIRNLAKESTNTVKHAISESKLANIRLSNHLENKAYRSIVENIARHPGKYKKMLNKQLGKELELVNQQMATKRFAEANSKLAELINIYGHIPELTFRQGVVQISRGNLRSGVRVLQQTAKQPMKKRQLFFDEVNFRLRNSKLSTFEKINLNKTARFADWKDGFSRGVFKNGNVSISGQGNQLKLSFRMGKNSKKLPVSPRELKAINANKKVIYIQDSPALNNFDWSASLNQSLNQVVSGRLGKVVKIPRGDVAHFKPSSIYSPNGMVRYKPITSPPPTTRYVPYPLPISSGGTGEEEEEPAVYLIISTENDSDL